MGKPDSAINYEKCAPESNMCFASCKRFLIHLKWDRTETPERLIRIHGNKDKVLPIGKRKVDYLIKGGGHFMIFNRADEISKILADVGVR